MKRRSFISCCAALFAPLGVFKSVPELVSPREHQYAIKPVRLTPGYSFVVVDLSNGPVKIVATDKSVLRFSLSDHSYSCRILSGYFAQESGFCSWQDQIPLELKHHDLEEFMTACRKAYPRTTLEFYEIYYTTKPNRNSDCFRYSNIYCRSVPYWNIPSKEAQI